MLDAAGLQYQHGFRIPVVYVGASVAFERVQEAFGLADAWRNRHSAGVKRQGDVPGKSACVTMTQALPFRQKNSILRPADTSLTPAKRLCLSVA